jgi:hypothetical protein
MKLKLSRALHNNRIKADAGKLAEALRGKVIGLPAYPGR